MFLCSSVGHERSLFLSSLFFSPFPLGRYKIDALFRKSFVMNNSVDLWNQIHVKIKGMNDERITNGALLHFHCRFDFHLLLFFSFLFFSYYLSQSGFLCFLASSSLPLIGKLVAITNSSHRWLTAFRASRTLSAASPKLHTHIHTSSLSLSQ
jgi:hypothetical protein